MEELEENIYKARISVDVEPNSFEFIKYQLLDTLGKAEYEDIAARLILIAKEYKQWVAVGWRAFAERLIPDMEAMAGKGAKPDFISALMFECMVRQWDVGYVMKCLNGMEEKGWIILHPDGDLNIIEPTNELIYRLNQIYNLKIKRSVYVSAYAAESEPR